VSGVENGHVIQSPPAERRFADELSILAAQPGDRPGGWGLTPDAVVAFICGSDGEKLSAPKDAPKGTPKKLAISPKFIGDRALVERAVVTLSGPRSLLLVGEPGTAKSMLSELLAAAISGTSELVVQGSAGTDEPQLRYGWNYSLLIAKGPSQEALVPSPVLTAMREGKLARIEEVTRCLPEVQDALVSLLSERRMAVAELAHTDYARPGFNVIATANLRDRGVSEMSAALKRRFNFETVHPIAALEDELALVRRQTAAELPVGRELTSADEAVLEAIVTLFRDLRGGKSVEGWAVDKPTAVMSAAEAVQVAGGVFTSSRFFPARSRSESVVGMLLGVVIKDQEEDRERLVAYWDSVVERRAKERPDSLWKPLFESRTMLTAR
jgi:MoxR-like ATPase